MRLHSIRLRNFRQHADTQVSFGPGLTGIVGTNGSGKSTVLEAMAWALYGMEATRGTKDTIRWHGAPARHTAEVALEFEVEGQMYRVTRSEHGADLDALVVDARFAYEPRASGLFSVNGAVRELLGMSYAEFSATYLCAQKDLLRLASMGAAERTTFYRNVMGIGRLDSGVKAAREAKNQLAATHNGMAAGLGDREPLASAVAWSEEEVQREGRDYARATADAECAREDLTAAQAALAESTRTAEEHARLTREREQAQRDAEVADRDVQRIADEVEKADYAAVRLASDGGALAARVEALRQERDALVQARTDQARRAQLELEIRAAREVMEEARGKVAAYDPTAHQKAVEDRTTARDEAVQLRDTRTAAAAQQASRATERQQHATRTRRKIDALRAAGAEGKCPTCAQALAGRLDAVLAEMEREERGALAEAQAAQAEAERLRAPSAEEDTLTARVAELEAAVREHEKRQHDAISGTATARREEENIARWTEELAAIPAAACDETRLARVRAELVDAEAAADAMAEVRVRAARAPALKEELVQALDTRREARERAEVLAAAAQDLMFEASAHGVLVERARQAQERAHGEATILARAEAALKAARQAHAVAARALEEYDARAARLEESATALRIEEQAAEGLNRFRQQEVAALAPELEALVSGFVADLTDGRYQAATVDESFAVTLHRDGIACDVISGGEEDVVAIALRLSTALLIAQRAGHTIGTLILDEPFGSQDEVRRRNILDLVSRRLRGIFGQVLIISHFPELQHAVDQTVLVELDEALGRSNVRVLGGAQEVVHVG